MNQRLQINMDYSSPVSPIPAHGDRYALPADFVNGLAFLRPLLPKKGRSFETDVNLIGGKLYLLTTKLIVECDAGGIDLPPWCFGPREIAILEAFKAPPAEVSIAEPDLCFRWADGQELLVHNKSGWRLVPQDHHIRLTEDLFRRFWRFTEGTPIAADARRALRKRFGGKEMAPDIFIDGQQIAGRFGGKPRHPDIIIDKTQVAGRPPIKGSEDLYPFPTNAHRLMRFDREAFLNMIRVADEIDFSVSPVCFRHAHGRGLLIERTVTTDHPDMGLSDE